MSMFILPVVVALLGAPQEAPADPPPLVTNPAEEAPARAFMEQVWRRYRRISSAGVTMTGTRTWARVQGHGPGLGSQDPDPGPGPGILREESWRRNLGEGILGEESWRRNSGG